MIGRLIPFVLALTVAMPATADAPLAPAPVTTCSLDGRACASHQAGVREVIVWRKGPRGTRQAAWRAQVTSSRLAVSDDARSLVELYPGLNLLDPDAGPDTMVLVFHRPGARPIPVRLRDVIADISRLPATASHRQWARAYGFDGRGSFLLLTAENRSLRFDPATGRQR